MSIKVSQFSENKMINEIKNNNESKNSNMPLKKNIKSPKKE